MALDHAIIVGSSFGGIVTAGVLSAHFDRVTIVERDTIPDEPIPRKGVPQGPHVHGILKLGRDILDDVFPGFVAETEREGAPLFDWLAVGIGYGPNGWTARGHSNVKGYGIRRPVLEHFARRRALALPNVEMVQGRVEGLVVSPSRRVVGVTLADGASATTIDDADLVVDASGRVSGTSTWLEQAGFEVPAETLVNGFGGYASRLLRVPEDAWPGTMRFIGQLPMPGNTKGAILYPQDAGLYIISLFGQSRDYPPGDEHGFDAFLAQCATPLFHQVVSRAEPVSEIRTSRATANRWRHFEDLIEPPAGLVALGDSASCFNPMNGQGISTACYGAKTLGETLTDLDGDLSKLSREFQQRLARRMDFPWRTALNYDFQFSATVGKQPDPAPEAAANAAYMKALGELATADPEAAEALFLSTQTFDPSQLRQPAIVAKVEAWGAGGHRPPYTDPAQPPPDPAGP